MTPRAQIKSRDRVRDLAEVYTNQREVDAMLDMIPDMFVASPAGADIKFLEPACGSGNFLEEIVRRKLNLIRFGSFRTLAAYEFRVLRAVASIYAVDICAENVGESRQRIADEVTFHYYEEPPAEFLAAMWAVLETNVILGDFLVTPNPMQVIDYQAKPGSKFLRVWSHIDGSPVLNDDGTEKRDVTPVYYRDLAGCVEPTTAP